METTVSRILSGLQGYSVTLREKTRAKWKITIMKRGSSDIKGTERRVCSVSQTHPHTWEYLEGTQLSIIQAREPLCVGGSGHGKPSRGKLGASRGRTTKRNQFYIPG